MVPSGVVSLNGYIIDNQQIKVRMPCNFSVISNERGGAGDHTNVCLHYALALVYIGALHHNSPQYQPICSHHSPHISLFLFNHIQLYVEYNAAAYRATYSMKYIYDQDDFKEQYCYSKFGDYLKQFYCF